MTLSCRHYGLLALLAFLLALPGRITLPPLDRDEARYMEASAQMLSSGNFLDIRFQDQPRYLQPAGIYWLETGSAKMAEMVAGPHVLHQVWPYRLPSLIAASLCIMLTAWAGANLFSASVGLLAAFFLMASILFVAESHMATIDTVLLLVILFCQSVLLRCFMARNAGQPASRKLACLYWAGLGLGLMLKGPVILIPCFGTLLALSACERNLTLWRRLYSGWGWLISLAIVLPWCLGIALVSHGEFFSHAVGHNLLGKVTHAQESHGFPPGYYLIVFLLAFWPGSFFAIRAIPQIWRERCTASTRFLLCWIIPHWVFFELLATKLPHYVLPTYPAIAILTAASLLYWKPRSLSLPGKFLTGFYGLLWICMSLVICMAGYGLLLFSAHTHSLRALLAMAGSLPLLIMAGLFLWRKEGISAACCAIGAAFITYLALFLAVIPQLDLIRFSPRIADRFTQIKPCPESVLISTAYKEPSLVFLAGEKTRLLSPELAASSLATHAQCDLALISAQQKTGFLEELQKQNMQPVPYGTISGFDYSNGHKMTLEFFAATPAKPKENP